ncbi:protein apnoia isoform X1 [Contarinia nasturtii]|uniref:protein apnoia isoform X1 n=1 Tax=Contarinia nasturtii TaxID=265458 RepID=UPI0012D4496F|nr:protein apnoia isoform X1 [Contarinia nasturtii]
MVNSMDKIILVAAVLCCVISMAACQNEVNNSTSDLSEAARTFGHHLLKRLTFAIIPTAFVVGVIITLLAALTIVSIKGLGVGVILLIIAIGQILARTFQAAPVPLPQYNSAIPLVYQRQEPIWFDKQW